MSRDCISGKKLKTSRMFFSGGNNGFCVGFVDGEGEFVGIFQTTKLKVKAIRSQKTADFRAIWVFIIHHKVIGGMLFCFAKLAIWRALPGPILVEKIFNGHYRGPKMKNAK